MLATLRTPLFKMHAAAARPRRWHASGVAERRRAGATRPRYLRRKQRIRDAAAEDAAAVAVAPPAGGGWAATRLAQLLRTASARLEALHPAAHRAGAGLRACTTRAPCKSELQGTGTQPAAALTTRPECSASERARREYAYLGAAAAARFGGTQPSMQAADATALLPTLAAAASPRFREAIGQRVRPASRTTRRPTPRTARRTRTSPAGCPPGRRARASPRCTRGCPPGRTRARCRSACSRRRGPRRRGGGSR